MENENQQVDRVADSPEIKPAGSGGGMIAFVMIALVVLLVVVEMLRPRG